MSCQTTDDCTQHVLVESVQAAPSPWKKELSVKLACTVKKDFYNISDFKNNLKLIRIKSRHYISMRVITKPKLKVLTF